MTIFNSYVKLPEGISIHNLNCVAFDKASSLLKILWFEPPVGHRVPGETSGNGWSSGVQTPEKTTWKDMERPCPLEHWSSRPTVTYCNLVCWVERPGILDSGGHWHGEPGKGFLKTSDQLTWERASHWMRLSYGMCIWLVVSTPLWKISELVNGKDDILSMKWKIKAMFETLNQVCYTYMYIYIMDMDPTYQPHTKKYAMCMIYISGTLLARKNRWDDHGPWMFIPPVIWWYIYI